jgi:hypothetical protein
VPLYATEVTLSGAPATYPFTLHGNAVVAQALEVFRRTLDEEAAAEVQDPAGVRAAIRRHFAVDRGEKARLATSVDLSGQAALDDDPVGSAVWLPVYEAVDRDDTLYHRTVRHVGAGEGRLHAQLARLVGPDAREVLTWLRRAPLDNGLAAEQVDAEGRAVANGGDAALAGLLASTVWYASQAQGERG